MFLLPDQQLRRADRVKRQRLVPYVHETLSHCQLRAFANEGEPEQSADFLARVKENKVDFLDFMVPGAWGTIWGTTWFEVRGRIDRDDKSNHFDYTEHTRRCCPQWSASLG